jgi:excisionase family DNA binding protein
MTDQLLLTVVEAAHQLGLGRSKLYELLAAGDIESVHIGKARRVPREALERYVGELRSQAKGQT